jgi:ribosome modulation factor
MMKTPRRPRNPQERAKFPPRIRFNWGYHDGANAAKQKRPYKYKHFDKVWLAGWQAGYEDERAGNYRESSDAAWSAARKKNPRGVSVPAAQMQQARKLFKDFSGHDLTHGRKIKAPAMPKVLIQIGTIDGVLYTTVRDGKTERYIHEFKRSARPTFAVSPDGKQLFMLGGAYNFTERGIVDKR